MVKYQILKHLFIVVLILSGQNLLSQGIKIIPYPDEIIMQEGFFTLTSKTRIYYDEGLKNEAEYLQKLIKAEQI